MELEIQNTISCPKSNPREWGRQQELLQPTGYLLGGLADCTGPGFLSSKTRTVPLCSAALVRLKLAEQIETMHRSWGLPACTYMG